MVDLRVICAAWEENLRRNQNIRTNRYLKRTDAGSGETGRQVEGRMGVDIGVFSVGERGLPGVSS